MLMYVAMKEFAPKHLWIDDNDIEKMTTRGVVSAYEGAYRADPDYSTQYIRADIHLKVLDLLKRSHGLYCHIGCAHSGICTEVNELFQEDNNGEKNNRT